MSARPLTLETCAAGKASQQWRAFKGTNCSDGRCLLRRIARGSGDDDPAALCIDIADYATKKGSRVDVYPCASDRIRQNENWAVQGSAIASTQPSTPFCLGITLGTGASAHAQLTDCTAEEAQFTIGFSNRPKMEAGTIKQKNGKGLCLAVAAAAPTPPPGPSSRGVSCEYCTSIFLFQLVKTGPGELCLGCTTYHCFAEFCRTSQCALVLLQTNR